MDRFILSLFTLFSIILLPIVGSTQKKESFTYPDNISDTAKKGFEKQFIQGKVIYSLTCGQCHNKKINGKDVIPDFNLPQLMDYEMRIYTQHGDKLDDRHITDEEMQKVVLYLRYKSRTGVYITPPPKQPDAVKPAGTQ